jgi:beta-mannosidase
MEKYQIADRLGGRFVSEFGMEAYPHLSTINAMITDPAQRHPGSMAMDSHNKAIGQERRLMSYMVENFRLDRTSLELGPFAHLTQVIQAETMRYAYKLWRRDWGVHGVNGDKDDTPPVRKCGGVLVWQLNDCWPTISWAIVDYHLVPKPAFYAIARAMQPLDVGISRVFSDWTQTEEFIDEVSGLKTGQVDHPRRVNDGSVFDVWIASSKLEHVSAQVAVRFVSVRTGKDVHEPIVSTAQARSNTTTTIHQSYQGPSPYTGSSDPTAAFDFTAYDPYLIHVSLSIDGALVASDSAWPEPYKYLDLHTDRGLKFSTSGADGDELTITSERPVKGLVFEEMPGLELSNNGIDVIPGEKQVVKVQGSPRADQLRYTYVGAAGASLRI